MIFHHAPCLVIGHSGLVTGTEPIDTVAALTYLELGSLTMGLGCCWAGLFLAAVKSCDSLVSYLKLPDGHKVHGAMIIGYPKFRFRRAPLRNSPDLSWVDSDPALARLNDPDSLVNPM